MKLKVCLTAALLCLFAFTAVAQHDHSAHAAPPQKPQMDPAMMDAMMKAGIPGDAHKKLDGMAGTWDTKITMWMMPGMDPMTSTGTSTNQWVMGGRYLEQYWGTWMDNMSTAMMRSTGTASADGKTWEFEATMSDPMTGTDTTAKEKLTVVDADHHTLEMWMAGPDGKMFKSMEIAYARKK